ncbi:hypothetical protein KY333_01135 [Candidatus Woesearchaeota archaeon]|nr:hypothetical protein [Candidatus Woesearchaeota archaeon]
MKKIFHKVDKARLRFVKVEFALLMFSLVLLALVFSRPEVIGYASTNIHSQDLNLLVDHSQGFFLRSVTQQPIHLTSLTISGEVIGKGTASVYLEDAYGIRHLVYKNMKSKDSTHNRITGVSAAGSAMSELSVTGNSLPAKEELPVLDLLEANDLYGYVMLSKGYKAVTGKFNNACVDSCILYGNSYIGTHFKLDFFVEPGTKLNINEIVYTTLEEI